MQVRYQTALQPESKKEAATKALEMGRVKEKNVRKNLVACHFLPLALAIVFETGATSSVG
jgi:hypothetical protein